MSMSSLRRFLGASVGLALLPQFLLLFLALPVHAQDVTLETSAEEYEFGTPVTFLLTNHTEEWITLPYTPPYDIYEQGSGETVGIQHYMMTDNVGPHETAEYTWDQTDGGGDQVSPGPYVAVIYYRIGPDDPWVPVSDDFVILDSGVSGVPDDPEDVRELTWGRLKRGWPEE